MDRRTFLNSVAGMSLGYSLYVRADAAEGTEACSIPRDTPEIQEAMDSLSPGPSIAERIASEPHMRVVDLDCDFFIAGGGMAGVCAALAAARNGAKVIIAQDRSRFGGNASSEIRMHIVGADCHGGHAGWREGGILEELRLENAYHNRYHHWEMWDLLLYDKLVSEPNIRLILDSSLYGAEVQDGRIQQVLVRCDKTEHIYRITSRYYADCTGDCRLGLEAGAAMRTGHESRDAFGESLAPETADEGTLGSSILFTAKDHWEPTPFTPPPWARKVTREDVKLRNIRSWEYGYWWIEWGGRRSAIHDNERIRFELLSIVLGVWDYIKNSGDFPESAPWVMDWIGMIPGKRASRRLEGPHILTQQDLMGESTPFPDAVAIGGWPLDNHPPTGFDDPEVPPFTPVAVKEPYNIPLRSLFSKNIDNLFMAGRNISASHVAFTSTRVMATCSVEGQAIGAAAAFCAQHDMLPKEVVEQPQKLGQYRQRLLRDDQSIRYVGNEDPHDLARTAKVSASGAVEPSKPENVIDGFVRDLPEAWAHRWGGPMGGDGAWLELRWDAPREIGFVQLTFDSGFHRELTLSEQRPRQKKIITGAQPELVKDYTLMAETEDGEVEELVRVEGNYLRLRRHCFTPRRIKALRLQVDATNGAEEARVYELRCYAQPPEI